MVVVGVVGVVVAVVVVVVVVKEKKKRVVPRLEPAVGTTRAERTILTCRHAETEVDRRAEAGTGKGAGSTIPVWLPAHMVPVAGGGC